MPEIMPEVDGEGFTAKTPDQAASELGQEQLAPVIPLKPEFAAPTAEETSTGEESYTTKYFDQKVEEAQRRYDNAQRMLDEARQREDESSQSLAQLQSLADETFVSLSRWKERAVRAASGSDENTSEGTAKTA